MTGEHVVVAHTTLGARAEATLSAAAASLEEAGATLHHIEIPASGLPDDLSDEQRELFGDFVATPEVLVEGWRAARHLESLTVPGDVVLVSELAAAGAGMFAIEQRCRPPELRREVVVAAGDGDALQHQFVTGTIEGLDADVTSAVDWELVGYRHAATVLASSPVALALLAGFRVDAAPAFASHAAVNGSPTGGEGIYVADPPSRLAQTGVVLRGLSGVGNAPIFVADGDRRDWIFTGTAWDAVGGIRHVIGDRLARGEPDAAAVVVIGDPFRLPDSHLEPWRGRARILAFAGSAIAARWPEAETWVDADDLARAVTEGGAGAPPSTMTPITRSRPPARADRAARVSVAVPVFGDVRFLDEAVNSILAQSQPPHELILVDDGSASPEVTEALAAAQRRDPDLVRVVTQPNRGVCVARNRAWEEMTGDAYLFVDSDDVLHPEFIEATATALRSDASLWAVATWTRFFGEYEGVEAKPPFDRRVGSRENPVVGTAMLLGPEVRDAGLGFAPDLAFLYCEDWDLWSRIVAAGGRIGLVPRALATHRVHPSSGGHARTELAHAIGKARATAHLR